MYYIIFDLEWNNAYDYKTGKGMNEIVEIGAVKLDEQLNIVDTFKQLLKPRIAKKLSGRFKELTHITSAEIEQNGIDFNNAFADFARWSEKEKSIFMSWSNSDLYALCDNFKKFKGTYTIDFITKYVDAQRYCMSFLPEEDRGNQISLAHCAQRFDIDVCMDGLHRALADCCLTAKCFKKVYNSDVFSNYVEICSRDFFDKLMFKPYFIKTDKTEGFDLLKISSVCPECGQKLKLAKPYEFSNNTFKNFGICAGCGKKYWLYVRAKQNYDGIAVTNRIVPMNKKRSNKLDSRHS